MNSFNSNYSPKNVLISYSRSNRNFILELDETLQKHGINAWIDERDIKPGYPWRDEIFKAIINCEYIIVCLSPDYARSEMCRMEIFLAQCYDKKILPIMIDKECWKELRQYRELSGMRDLSVINFVNNIIFGLPITKEDQLKKIVTSIIGDLGINKKKHEVYVSYKSEDAQYATRVSDNLNNKGISTWIATRNYDVGEKWQESQWKALMAAQIIIVILGKNTAKSEYIRNEILVAITRKLPIIPILIEDEELNGPDFTRRINKELSSANNFEMRWVSDIHWFYPNQPNYKSMIDKVEKAIINLKGEKIIPGAKVKNS